MAITKDDILEAVGNLTVLELNDLVKAFEEKFGVSAAAMAVAAPGAGRVDDGGCPVRPESQPGRRRRRAQRLPSSGLRLTRRVLARGPNPLGFTR